MSALDIVLGVADVAALVVANAKWLRVAQREHYDPRGRDLARLWNRVDRRNAALMVLALVLWVAGLVTGVSWLGLVSLAAAVAWPLGLSLRPTSARLAFTPRLRRLLATAALVEIVVLALPTAGGVGVGARVDALWALAAPLLIDAATVLVAPVERRLGQKYVRSAQARLKRVRPTVVAITGSYGKTSTKNYARQLISASKPTAASPASFNNLMGLSRAVNDNLPEGTEVFVAEMGTYGPGEIRALCEIFTPDVSAIITIGEAHLERMKNRATIVAAKSEITERPGTVVLNVDVPELATLADALDATKRVLRVSTRPDSPADAVVTAKDDRWSVTVRGEYVADVDAPPTGHPVNLAVAVGLALAVDVPVKALARALGGGLPGAPHRAEISRTDSGVLIIDDTYNANPTGADQAVRAARELAGGHRVFTITPGMVELGSRQAEANRELGTAATAAPNMMLAVTGRTNRAALVAGATGPGTVATYPDRQRAATAVLAQAQSGDVVVYLNDLPDHYP